MTKFDALKAKNWTQFAMGYNGPSQSGYDTKMKKNYESLKDDEFNGLEDGTNSTPTESPKDDTNSILPNTQKVPSLDKSIEGFSPYR